MESNENLNYAAMSDEDFDKLDSPTDAMEAVVQEEAVTQEQSTPEPGQATETTEAVVEETIVAFPEDFDYKEAYLNLRKPFKANGKQVVIKSDQEMIQLMQMGIGYTAKSQKLNQQAKLAGMLEKGGITLDDIPFLIDLKQKKPDAIQKYFKDANIDPLDVDITSEPKYVQGNYSVTDKELAFTTMLEEVSANQTGKEFLGLVHRNWDNDSKNLLWESAEILPTLAEQYYSGVYTKVVQEMDRQKAIGTIPNSIPFLHAYKLAGDTLLQQVNSTTNSVAKVSMGQSNSGSVVGRRTNQPTQNTANSTRAKSAMISHGSQHTGSAKVDYSLMSDEEFMRRTSP